MINFKNLNYSIFITSTKKEKMPQKKTPDYQKNTVSCWGKSKLNRGVYKKTTPISKNPNMNKAKTTSNLNQLRYCGDYIEINNIVVENKLQPSTIARNVNFVQTFAENVNAALLTVLETYAKNRLVVGCVAWFNSNAIIDLLCHCKGVSLIVNDEDYRTWGFRSVKKEKFDKLPAFKKKFSEVWGQKIADCEINCLKRSNYPPVMAFGVGGAENAKNASTMHSKFIIICDDNDMPWALWSGTNNFTIKSERNIENAFFFINPELAMFYFRHYARTMIFSSPLKF